jgi:hypothetical protein
VEGEEGMLNKTLLEPASMHTEAIAATIEAANQFSIAINVKQPLRNRDQQEHATIHRKNVQIPVPIVATVLKHPPDFGNWQFDLVLKVPNLGFIALQHPYLNSFSVNVTGVDAERAIHVKDV